jgi:hypothetical protein
MPPSNSLLAHRDVQAALDRALANGRGVRIRVESAGHATNLRQRCYKVRELDRRENAKIFPHDNPMHGRSVYDALTMTPAEDDGTVYLVIEVSSPERLEEVMEDLE